MSYVAPSITITTTPLCVNFYVNEPFQGLPFLYTVPQISPKRPIAFGVKCRGTAGSQKPVPVVINSACCDQQCLFLSTVPVVINSACCYQQCLMLSTVPDVINSA